MDPRAAIRVRPWPVRLAQRALAMSSIYDLKPRFQSVLRPLCSRLAAAGVSANAVTLAALLLSIAHGAWIAARPHSPLPLLCLPITLFIRMALNATFSRLAEPANPRRQRGSKQGSRPPGRSRELPDGGLGPILSRCSAYTAPMLDRDHPREDAVTAAELASPLPRGIKSNLLSYIRVVGGDLAKEEVMGFGRGALLWLLGIPLPIILLLALFWHH